MTPEAPPEEPKIITLAEGFHVRQEVDNIAWIDLGGYAIVVDALEQKRLRDEVFEAIRATLGETPVRYVLNTHTHHDHVALNDAFRKRHGAEIVNERTADIPSEGRWFQGERRRALMLPMGGCHTSEDCIVWAPDDRVLFTGDLFGWGLVPLAGGLSDERAALLLGRYRRMIELDPRVVVPGHGPLCSRAELERWVEYFHWLGREAADAARRGKSDAEIDRQLAPPEDMTGWWRFTQWKHADSVSKVLRAVRRGWRPAES